MPSLFRWCSSRWEEVEAMPELCRSRRAADRVLARVIWVRSAPMIGRERQTAIYLGGVSGRRPRVPLDPERLQEAARKAISADAFAYVAAGARPGGPPPANPAGLPPPPAGPPPLGGAPRAPPAG